jgi:ubiquinone/menaquinone biosynthesis C-methylase UbiE
MKLISVRRSPLNENAFTGAAAAQFYDEHARHFMGSVYRRFTRKAAALVPAGARVLDVGTGTGRLALELAKARPDLHIIGVDISVDMIDIARQNAARSGLSAVAEFRPVSAASLPFPDNYFALVTSNASLHLWSDPAKVLDEIARVTAPGGCCLVRDNLRLAVISPFLGLAGRVMGMNKAQRRLWLEAVRASYTPGEVKKILRNSSLKDARVSVAPDLLYLDISWRKPRV